MRIRQLGVLAAYFDERFVEISENAPVVIEMVTIQLQRVWLTKIKTRYCYMGFNFELNNIYQAAMNETHTLYNDLISPNELKQIEQSPSGRMFISDNVSRAATMTSKIDSSLIFLLSSDSISSIR